jgi:hypothetical protein
MLLLGKWPSIYTNLLVLQEKSTLYRMAAHEQWLKLTVPTLHNVGGPGHFFYPSVELVPFLCGIQRRTVVF